MARMQLHGGQQLTATLQFAIYAQILVTIHINAFLPGYSSQIRLERTGPTCMQVMGFILLNGETANFF